MKSTLEEGGFRTFLDEKDKQVLSKFIEFCTGRVTLPEIGRYRKQTPEQTWIELVGQVCVMGGARPWERLFDNKERKAAFLEAVSMREIYKHEDRVGYLARQLDTFKAARFHNKSAEKLISMLSNPAMFNGGNLILFEGLSEREDTHLLREKLIRRNPIFRLKSASDFMITMGLSHDVIPLDTRIVGMFHRYFDYNYEPGAVQDKPLLYLSVEDTLRQFCRENNISLALLDRILFKYSGMSLIEFLLGK